MVAGAKHAANVRTQKPYETNIAYYHNPRTYGACRDCGLWIMDSYGLSPWGAMRNLTNCSENRGQGVFRGYENCRAEPFWCKLEGSQLRNAPPQLLGGQVPCELVQTCRAGFPKVTFYRPRGRLLERCLRNKTRECTRTPFARACSYRRRGVLALARADRRHSSQSFFWWTRRWRRWRRSWPSFCPTTCPNGPGLSSRWGTSLTPKVLRRRESTRVRSPPSSLPTSATGASPTTGSTSRCIACTPAVQTWATTWAYRWAPRESNSSQLVSHRRSRSLAPRRGRRVTATRPPSVRHPTATRPPPDRHLAADARAP